MSIGPERRLRAALYRLFRADRVVCVVCFVVAAEPAELSRPSNMTSRQPKTVQRVPHKHGPT